jgi:hypothetical protein
MMTGLNKSVGTSRWFQVAWVVGRSPRPCGPHSEEFPGPVGGTPVETGVFPNRPLGMPRGLRSRILHEWKRSPGRNRPVWCPLPFHLRAGARGRRIRPENHPIRRNAAVRAGEQAEARFCCRSRGVLLERVQPMRRSASPGTQVERGDPVSRSWERSRSTTSRPDHRIWYPDSTVSLQFNNAAKCLSGGCPVAWFRHRCRNTDTTTSPWGGALRSGARVGAGALRRVHDLEAVPSGLAVARVSKHLGAGPPFGQVPGGGAFGARGVRMRKHPDLCQPFERAALERCPWAGSLRRRRSAFAKTSPWGGPSGLGSPVPKHLYENVASRNCLRGIPRSGCRNT